jgi:hypothetical protein
MIQRPNSPAITCPEILSVLALALPLVFAPAANAAAAVLVKEANGKLQIEIGGKPFSDYYYQNVSRPYLYPILGPGGAPMTRNYPMKDVPDEERDHPHHRSLWYAHGAINGHDFWSEGKNAGKTIHEKFLEIKSGDVGVIKSLNKLVANDGTLICTDERTIRIHKDGRTLDYDITVHASNGKLTFGDTKEGTMAIRLAETMRQKGKVGRGHIINSEGVRDGDTWGKRAKWCDYYGPVDGKTVGVAIFDHPQNPRHPTWWHVRDYGLFAANPFGIHDFEKSPDKNKGNLEVAAGQSVTFRYRFYLHEGDEKEGKIAEQYEQYARAAIAK